MDVYDIIMSTLGFLIYILVRIETDNKIERLETAMMFLILLAVLDI